MSKTLTEQKVLKKLDIQDFRYLTKDKVLTMASMLDKMDPEVAKKAIEQFPEFSGTMKEILQEYKNSIDKVREDNAESVKSFYESCDMIIFCLQKELDKEELSFDDKKYIIDNMMEINKLKGDKDSENKKFLAVMSVMGLAAVGIAAGALLSALGGNTTIDSRDKDNI